MEQQDGTLILVWKIWSSERRLFVLCSALYATVLIFAPHWLILPPIYYAPILCMKECAAWLVGTFHPSRRGDTSPDSNRFHGWAYWSIDYFMQHDFVKLCQSISAAAFYIITNHQEDVEKRIDEKKRKIFRSLRAFSYQVSDQNLVLLYNTYRKASFVILTC